MGNLIFVGVTQTKSGQTRYIYYDPEHKMTVNLARPIEDYDYSKASPPSEEIRKHYSSNVYFVKDVNETDEGYQITFEQVKKVNPFLEQKKVEDEILKQKIIATSEKLRRPISDTGLYAIHKITYTSEQKGTFEDTSAGPRVDEKIAGVPTNLGILGAPPVKGGETTTSQSTQENAPGELIPYERSWWEEFKDALSNIPIVSFFQELHTRVRLAAKEDIYRSAQGGSPLDAIMYGASYGILTTVVDLPGTLYELGEMVYKTTTSGANIGSWTGIGLYEPTQNDNRKITLPSEREQFWENIFMEKYKPEDIKELETIYESQAQDVLKEGEDLQKIVQSLEKERLMLENWKNEIFADNVVTPEEAAAFNYAVTIYNKRAEEITRKIEEYNRKVVETNTIRAQLENEYGEWQKNLKWSSIGFAFGSFVSSVPTSILLFSNIQQTLRYLAPENVVTQVKTTKEKSPMEIVSLEKPTTPIDDISQQIFKEFRIKYDPTKVYDVKVNVIRVTGEGESFIVNTLETPLDDILSQYGKISTRYTVKSTLYKGWLHKTPIETWYRTELRDPTKFFKEAYISYDEVGAFLKPSTEYASAFKWGGKDIGVIKIADTLKTRGQFYQKIGTPENWKMVFSSGNKVGIYYDPVKNLEVISELTTIGRGFNPYVGGGTIKVLTPELATSSHMIAVPNFSGTTDVKATTVQLQKIKPLNTNIQRIDQTLKFDKEVKPRFTETEDIIRTQMYKRDTMQITMDNKKWEEERITIPIRGVKPGLQSIKIKDIMEIPTAKPAPPIPITKEDLTPLPKPKIPKTVPMVTTLTTPTFPSQPKLKVPPIIPPKSFGRGRGGRVIKRYSRWGAWAKKLSTFSFKVGDINRKLASFNKAFKKFKVRW